MASQKLSGEKFAVANQFSKERDFWLEKLAGELTLSSFPYDDQQAQNSEHEMDSVKFGFSEEMFSKLMKLSNGYDYTLHMILMAGFVVLLERYTSNKDIIVGMPIYKQEVEGKFINTVLAIRNRLTKKMTFKDLLLLVRQNIVEATEHQNYPMETLAYKLDTAYSTEEFFLFDTALLLENIHDKKNIQHMKLNTLLSFKRMDTSIKGIFEYNKSTYTKATIERIVKHYLYIMKQALSDVNILVNQIRVLSDGEEKQLLVEFNQTKVQYSPNKSICDLFEEQVEKTPDQIALVLKDQQMTYQELNVKSNQLARVLRRKGVSRNKIVAIMLENSFEMIISIFGILKAGGAYLPIDPAYPEKRIKYILEDSNAELLLTTNQLIDNVCYTNEWIDVEDETLWQEDGSNLEDVNDFADLAYLIYTSGSTGKPKGVMIEHKGIANTINWRKNEYNFDSEDVLLQLFSYAFDGFAVSFFTPIVSGSKVVLMSSVEVVNPYCIKECLISEKITYFICVPSLYESLLQIMDGEKLPSLKIVGLAGDKITKNLITKSNDMLRHIELINEYGPSENSVETSIQRNIQSESKITIGKPIANTQIYILDQDDRLAPVGVSGELCISGAGLARGYLNKQTLTEEKFVKNPFYSDQRLYRTGDKARWTSEGKIEFLGRLDRQVKIRGFRIEMEEIENQLLKHDSIENAAVVTLKNKQGDNYLVAYIVLTTDLSINDLKSDLGKDLPYYMIPSTFVKLEKMPLSWSGKIDRKALPAPDVSAEIEYVAPRDEIEKSLAEIWSEVLESDQDKIGIDHNFFDLGGHSLKATMLISKIFKVLNVQVPVEELFNLQTIRELAVYVKGAEKESYRSIEPAEKKDYYQLSSAQKRIFIIQQTNPMNVSYNVPTAFVLEGKLDKDKLEDTINQLIQRHDSLRTSFCLKDGEPVQKIHDDVDFMIPYFELSEEEAKEYQNQFVKPFNLDKAPLLRLSLVKTAEERHILMLDIHHIISDGYSESILIKDLMALYEDQELSDLVIQYKDYSEWQNRLFDSGKIKEQEEYWLSVFADEVSALNMPTDYPRPAVKDFKGDSIDFTIDDKLAKRLNELAQETGSTLYMVLLALYNVSLARYTGQEDLVIGSPIAGRTWPGLENIIGMFANTLALRNYPQAELTFIEFLREVKKSTLKAYQNQDYPFEMLVEKLNLSGDMSKNPLFDAMLVMQNMNRSEIEFTNLKLAPYHYQNKTSKFDLLLGVAEQGEQITCTLEYSTQLFKENTIQSFVEHFIKITEILVHNPEVKLGEFDYLSESDKTELLNMFNDTHADFEVDLVIHHLFERQVEKTPDHTAVIFEDQKLTYRELNDRANQLALLLRQKGVGPDKIVAIMARRSPEMVIGILGILKAGGAYLPIDQNYPEERITYMLKDSETELLLTQKDLISNLHFNGEVVFLDDAKRLNTESEGVDNPINLNQSDDLIYVIYTSGSTGQPKGVMLEHKNLANLLNFQFTKTDIPFDERVLQFSTISFDLSFQEMFSTLLRGGELHLISQETKDNYKKLLNYVKDMEISVLVLPTSFLKFIFTEEEYYNEFPRTVKHIITAGEQLIVTDELRKYLQENQVTLHNHYGPSETHVVTTLSLTPDNEIPGLPSIGRPIDNTQIYILDRMGNLQPVGVVGELFIGGMNVGRGYLNRPELTEERYLNDPFISGQRMYKTGDLARWLKDGTIEFLGRADHQVKIRGFRIELGEIESRLLAHGAVKEVVVKAWEENGGQKYLCAYYVSEEELKGVELRSFLGEIFPDYMIPAYFIQLEKMPLTPNGKIDRKVLTAPDDSLNISDEYLAPENEVEEKLVTIWAEVLGLSEEKISISASFFELGGHSLRAAAFVAKAFKEFHVEIPLRQVFVTSTIRELAEYIEMTERRVFSSIQPVEEQEYYPLSSAQKRLFILNQFESMDTSYNMPGAMIMEGKLDVQRLEVAFQKFIQRHESLRTSFEFVNGEPVQRIHEEIDFKIDYISVENEDLEVESLIKKFVKPFDLNQAPLLRVGLIKLSQQLLEKERYMLVFDMHHIISDGITMNILIKEVICLYEGNELPELRIQYKDYAAWQKDLFTSEKMKNLEEYWINQFRNEIPVLNMPSDYPRPAMKTFVGNHFEFDIDRELSEKLNEFATKRGTTLFMVLLAAYNVLLSKYSGQEDIVIGSPNAGRSHTDLENIVGIFLNTLALRNYPEHNKTFTQFLDEVKESTLQAYENQDYQFEMLVEKLHLTRDLSHSPLFDVTFVLQNYKHEEIELNDLKFIPYPFENKTAKYDLTLFAHETEKDIQFTFVYCTDLYRTETIEKLSKQFVNIMSQVVKNSKIMISEIQILSEDEKEDLLAEFNAPLRINNLMDQTFQDVLYRMAEKNPDQPAIEYGSKIVTYAELDKKSNRIANLLLTKGLSKDSKIGILTDDRSEIIAIIFGVLKAGAIFVPFDTSYPIKRLETLINIANPEIIFTDHNNSQQIKNLVIDEGSKAEIIILEDEEIDNAQRPIIQSSPDDKLYIYFTSGSTGQPKGIVGRYESLLQFVTWEIETFKIDSSYRITQLASPGFDAFLKDIFVALHAGGTVCIPENRDVILDSNELVNWIDSTGIHLMHCVPSVFKSLNLIEIADLGEVFKDLKYIILAGERINPQTLSSWYDIFGERIQLVNLYGPTETTLIKTCYFIHQSDCIKREIPIGTPMKGSRLIVLDQNMNPCGKGIIGEIYIRTVYGTYGYYNNPELTNEKFVPNPFSNDSKDLLYKTGDLGRLLLDGKYEFVGRIDNQVKIRGIRIELGDIENQILNHENVKEVTVMMKEDSNSEKYLCGYLVVESQKLERSREVDFDPFAAELREYLRERIPEYMIPAYFVLMDYLPLTPNGKIDRKALPEPKDHLLRGVAYEAPNSEVEKSLAEIWSQILEVAVVGVNDNFFDLGGHSLKAMALLTNIYQKYNVQLTIRDIFKYPKIKTLSRTIELVNEFGPEKSTTPYMLLNEKRENNIFCFPPILGYGILYQGLASLIDTHSVYGFDFIEGEDSIEKYVEALVEIQNTGPYIFLGHSIGGGLSFEIAKAMIERGHEVSDIIMFDSTRYEKEENKTEQEIIQEADEFFDLNQNNPTIRQFLEIESLNLELRRKVKNYIGFKYKIVNSSVIDANLHFIKAENSDRLGWAGSTSEKYIEYQGFGSHSLMLNNDHLINNLPIIKSILSKV